MIAAPAPVLSPLVARLVELIDLDGRTRKQIAAVARVPESTLSRILIGEVKRPSARDVTRIARALGLSATALGRMQYEADPE